jgi:hypothetical protein
MAGLEKRLDTALKVVEETPTCRMCGSVVTGDTCDVCGNVPWAVGRKGPVPRIRKQTSKRIAPDPMKTVATRRQEERDLKLIEKWIVGEGYAALDPLLQSDIRRATWKFNDYFDPSDRRIHAEWQQWNWQGYKDSSAEAKHAMAQKIRDRLKEYRLKP